MKCPNCSKKLGKVKVWSLAEHVWFCKNCMSTWFIINTSIK